MRNVIIVGGASSSGIVNRLAAELANREINDVNLIVVESELEAHQAAEKLKAAEDAPSEASLSERDLLVIGGCFSGLSQLCTLNAIEFEVPTVEYVNPRLENGMYWQQGNHKFDRKQQGMKAKARRR